MKKLLYYIIIPFKIIYSLLIAIFKSLTIDLVKNIKLAFVYSFNMEKRNQINREIQMKKLTESFDERLSAIERLLYAIMEDSEYLKTKKGKLDINDLKKKVK